VEYPLDGRPYLVKDVWGIPDAETQTSIAVPASLPVNSKVRLAVGVDGNCTVGFRNINDGHPIAGAD
jgi:hypothetical protein